MARDHDDHTARNVALVGGAALVVWLLFRGKGLGLGSGGGIGLGGAAGSANNVAPAGQPATPCRVWIRADGIEVDGTAADLPAVVARCRATGRADVTASGAAIVHVIADVVRALQAAGVGVSAPPDVWNTITAVPERTR